MPHTLEADDQPKLHPNVEMLLKYEVPERYLATIQGAKILTVAGGLLLPDGQLVYENYFTMPDLIAIDQALGEASTLPIKKMKGEYLSLLVLWGNLGNYYHWIHDVVLRLYLVLDKLDPGVKIILPDNLTPWQAETLCILGIPEERRIFYDGTEVWEVETLHFAPPTSDSGQDAPWADAWFRDLTLKAYDIPPIQPNKRIFISRRFASRRRIDNEDEVEGFLRDHGFETCRTETLSLQEQVLLFSQASVIVSNEGAGLTNMLFATPGATIINIMEPSYMQYCYWCMSEALGHRYWVVIGETVPTANASADVNVSIEKLKKIFELNDLLA